MNQLKKLTRLEINGEEFALSVEKDDISDVINDILTNYILRYKGETAKAEDFYNGEATFVNGEPVPTFEDELNSMLEEVLV